MSVALSVDFNNEIVAKAPECGGIGDAQHLVAVALRDYVGAFGLVCENFGLVGIEVDSCKSALVADGEEVSVEVALHKFGLAEEPGLDNTIFLKFVFSSYRIVAKVEFICKLGIHLLGRVALSCYSRYGRSKRVDLCAKFTNLDFGVIEVCAEAVDFGSLGIELCTKLGDSVFQSRVRSIGCREFLFGALRESSVLRRCRL